jgi:aminoglycoside phosphotransferase (APT) family kinase protein
MEFIEGESLRDALVRGVSWAEDVYLDAVCMLQGVSRAQLGSTGDAFGDGSTACDTLDWVAERFPRYTSDPLVDTVYRRLRRTIPPLPEVRFGNGDLSPGNMIVRDGKLAGIVDFEFAGFFDPLYEFMAPFGWCPELRDKGLEERYCKRTGFPLKVINWYHAACQFGLWLEMVSNPKAECEGCTAESCRTYLEQWARGGM